MSKVHIVIPDAHADPDHNLERFDYLGPFINDVKPDVVLNIGDWADMSSLSSYDKGKKSYEGRRYYKDIEVANEALDRMMGPVNRQKKKKPRFVSLLGNHENRINRAIEYDPILEGTISTDDILFKEYGHEVFPFLETVNIDGINYCHYFVSGIMGRPIGGEHHANSLITKQLASCTQGHSHLFDHAVRTDATGKKLMGCVVGVYQDYDSAYAGPANRLWSRGIVVKREVNDGVYDVQWISLDTLRKEYA